MQIDKRTKMTMGRGRKKAGRRRRRAGIAEAVDTLTARRNAKWCNL